MNFEHRALNQPEFYFVMSGQPDFKMLSVRFQFSQHENQILCTLQNNKWKNG